MPTMIAMKKSSHNSILMETLVSPSSVGKHRTIQFHCTLHPHVRRDNRRVCKTSIEIPSGENERDDRRREQQKDIYQSRRRAWRNAERPSISKRMITNKATDPRKPFSDRLMRSTMCHKTSDSSRRDEGWDKKGEAMGWQSVPVEFDVIVHAFVSHQRVP